MVCAEDGTVVEDLGDLTYNEAVLRLVPVVNQLPVIRRKWMILMIQSLTCLNYMLWFSFPCGISGGIHDLKISAEGR